MDGQVVTKSITDVLTDLASMKAHLSSDEWEETCLQHQVTLEQNIASCTGFTLPQATDLITALGQAAVPDSFKSDLCRAVQNKILGRDSQGMQRQQCTHLEAFIPQWLWDCFFDLKQWEQHVASMGRHMERMGLSNANESTFQCAVALISMARMQAAMQNKVCAKTAYQMLQDLKKCVRTFTKKQRLPHYDKVKVYPATPAALKIQHPELYNIMYEGSTTRPEWAPFPCPLRTISLEMLKQRLPMRCTHREINLEVPLFAKIAATSGRDEISLPGFRICPHRSPTIENMDQAAVVQATRPCYALEDQSPQPSQAPAEVSPAGTAGHEPARRMNSFQVSPAGTTGHEPAERMNVFQETISRIQGQCVPPTTNLPPLDMQIEGQALKTAEEDEKDEEDEDPAPQIKKRPCANSKGDEKDEEDEGPASQTKKRPCSNSKEEAAEAAPKAKKCKHKAADAAPKTPQIKKHPCSNSEEKAAQTAPKAKKCAAPKTNANMLPPYPGQPKKRVPPVHVKDFALYTDMRMRAWRLKRHGEKRDKAFSFRKDPKDAWNKLCKVIRTG